MNFCMIYKWKIRNLKKKLLKITATIRIFEKITDLYIV